MTHGTIAPDPGLMLDVSGLHAYQSELQRERIFPADISNTQSLILVVDTAVWSVMPTVAVRCRLRTAGTAGPAFVGNGRAGLRSTLSDALNATSAAAGGQPRDAGLRGHGAAGQFSVNLSPMRDDQARSAASWWS